jgi:hypothetical protein
MVLGISRYISYFSQPLGSTTTAIIEKLLKFSPIADDSAKIDLLIGRAFPHQLPGDFPPFS